MANDPLLDQLLASSGYTFPEDQADGLGDQLAALQGLRPAEPPQEQGLWGKVFQPVRTAFGFTGGLGGRAAGVLAPEAYKTAEEELRRAHGVTAESPWYRQTEATPTLGDVAVAGMSPEFRASGVGRVVEPLTRLVGGIVGDPTSYLGGAAVKAARGVAAKVAPEAVAALAAAPQAERATHAGEIAARVLAEGTPMQRALWKGGTAFLDAEPLAFAAPAALAYGPATIEAAYEQASQIPESETPWADAASVALLSGMTVLMGKGLLDANRAMKTWRNHAQSAALAPDVIQQGEARVVEAVQATEDQIPRVPDEAVSVAPEPYTPGVTRVAEADVPTAEPIPGAPVRVAEAGIPQAEPLTGVRRVAEAGEPQQLPDEAVSLVPEELPVVEGKVVQGLAPDIERFIAKNEGKVGVSLADQLQRRFRVGRTQAEAWVEQYRAKPVEPGAQAATAPPSPQLAAPKPPPPKPPAPAGAEAALPVEPTPQLAAATEREANIPNIQPEPAPRVADDLQQQAATLDARLKATNLKGWEERKVAAAFGKGKDEAERIKAVNDALDYVDAERAKKAPAPTPATASLEDQLKASLGETPTKPPEPTAAPPKPAAPAKAAAPQPEPTAPSAALSAKQTESWGRYTKALDDRLAATKDPAEKQILTAAKAAAAKATPDDQRAIVQDMLDNFGGRADRYVKGKAASEVVQRGESLKPTTGAKATAGVEMGAGRVKPLAKSAEFDEARKVLKGRNVTLRQFMDDPDSGPLEYVENKGGGRTTSHNLKNPETRFGKVWNRYVDLLDAGKSDSEARKIVVEAEKMTDNVVNNVVRAGRAGTRFMVVNRFADVDKPVAKKAAAVVDRPALEAQRVKAESAASSLAKQVEAVGQITDDVKKNVEFRTSVESTLDEAAKHLVNTRGLGARDPLRSLDALKSLAQRMGISESQMGRNTTGEEILQMVADKAGISRDYVGLVRGQLQPKSQPAAQWAPTILHPGEWGGGKEGFVFRVEKLDDPAVLANDIASNPEMALLALGEGVKSKQLKALEAALPDDITLKPREMAADTLIQTFDVVRAKKPKEVAPGVEENRIDNTADYGMSPEGYKARAQSYREDVERALKMGDTGLVAANQDRLMSADFMAKLHAVSPHLAEALEKVHDRLVARMLTEPMFANAPRQIRFRGITASPFVAGLTHGEPQNMHMFINPLGAIIKAARKSKTSPTREAVVHEMLDTVMHENTHAKISGHPAIWFDSTADYLKRMTQAEGLYDDLYKQLDASFDEDTYKAFMKLLPEWDQTRRKYGTSRKYWGSGEAQRRISAVDAEGGTAALADRRAGSEGAPAGDLDGGVRPGEAVPGGGEGQAGRLGAGAAAERATPGPTAKGSAAGLPAGKRTEAALQAIEERAIGEQGVTRGEAQLLMDDLIEEGKAKLTPVRDIYRRGYEYAKLVEAQLTDADRAELSKSLPSPRKPDQREGVVNLLHYTEMDDRMKARIALMHDFTKGAWARDKRRGWEDVGQEVQDMLGINTPEEWTRIYKSKSGGLLDRDVELLRQVHNDLSGQLLGAEDRLFGALESEAPAETLNKLRGQVEYAERAFHHSMYNLSKGLTGVGRALAIARHQVRNLDPVLRMDQDIKAGLRERMRFKFKDPGEAENATQKLMEEFKKVRDQRGSVEEFYKAYRAMMGSKLWPDKILEFYKAGLLGYPSRVANISSNVLFRSVRYLEDAMAGALDAGRAGVTGTQRERYIGEASVSSMALSRALKEGFGPWLKAQGDAFALRPQDMHEALKRGGLMEDLLMHPGAIEGKKGEFVRFMFKGLSSDDSLSKHVARLDNMYRDIYRSLQRGVEFKVNAGENLTAATERVFNQLKSNYDDAIGGRSFDYQQLKRYQHLATQAEEAALRETFQSDLGNFGRGMNWLLRTMPALQIVFPFVRTPTNIAKETLKRTPLGFLNVARKWKSMDEGQRMTEMAKPAVGSLIGAGILAQAMAGDVTGGGPVNQDELEALKATGWQPYSAKIGDNWVSYQRLEPIAAIMGIAADAAEGLRNGDFQRWQDGAVKVFQSTAENVTNKTFLSGLDGMFSAVSHPKEYLARFVKQMQGSAVPNSLGFVPVSGMTRALDPVYRQTDPFSMNVFWNKVPFLSSQLDPQYGPTGEERLRAGSAVERLVSPFARTEVKHGPGSVGTEEVVRLSAVPRAPGRYWTGRGGVRVDFTPEERQQLAKSHQEATNVIGARLINDPNYKRLPDNDMDPNYRYGMKTKADVVKRLYGKYRDTVMDRIKPRLEARAVQQTQPKGRT